MARTPVESLTSEYSLFILYEGSKTAYVGLSSNPKQQVRMTLSRLSGWRYAITSFEIERLPGYSKKEALELRSAVIKVEKPRFNR